VVVEELVSEVRLSELVSEVRVSELVSEVRVLPLLAGIEVLGNDRRGHYCDTIPRKRYYCTRHSQRNPFPAHKQSLPHLFADASEALPPGEE